MATSLEWVETLKTRFEGKILSYGESAPGEPEIMVAANDAQEFISALKTLDGGPFEHLADLTAYDNHPENPRFVVVYELISMTRKQRCSVLVPAEAVAPSAEVSLTRYAVPTITNLWKGANWLERETYDLVGVEFTGHPDMRRILLPQQFVGHPLQKDFTLDYRQQFAESDTEAPIFDPFGNTLIERGEIDMAYKFSPDTEKQFQWLTGRYPSKQAVLIPLLHIVQDEVGYLSADAIDYVAERMTISPAKVREVASFYTMFKFDQQGKYRLQVCHNLTCYLRGSDELLDRLKNTLGIKEGETTPDGKFGLERVECLGSCGTGPVMQVNVWDFMENLDVEKLDKVVELLKQDKAASASYSERIRQGGVA